MKLVEYAKAAGSKVGYIASALAVLAPATVLAQAPAATPSVAASAATVSNYARMKPVEGKGMPVDGGLGLQDQFTDLGIYARWIHDVPLLYIITLISLFVLGLLIWVVLRYNRRANPVPSKTTHNTLIEVIWIAVPVLILAGIAVPSLKLLSRQFEPAPEKALTVKATGSQWFWTYTYPDNGGIELTSYMLNEPNSPTVNNGVRVVGSDPSDGPAQLEVDNRLVLPVGEPIRMQITATDVIHAFAVPSLWFKLDAVPGKINEKVLTIKEPGVYYGQCSELCGAKHGYMPIAVEALPRDQFNAWVLKQAGGALDNQPAPAADASAAPAAAAAAAPAASSAPAPAAGASQPAPTASASAPAA
jgi:cytochrome c oxidase subunit II